MASYPPLQIPMQGKTCLVTGATSGIGLVTARELARMGARVVLVGRNQLRGEVALQWIKQTTDNPEVDYLQADLSSQQEVRRLAEEFQVRHSRLEVLVNNAGAIMLSRQESVDGIELTFALNHLAYFLLTNLLLDTLKASAPARVVNVSSGAHHGAVLDFDDLESRSRYKGFQAYSRSKLANVLFTYEMARRLEGSGVTANVLHPGLVATNFGGNNGWKGSIIKFLMRLKSIGPEEGADTCVYLSAAPTVEGVTGKYFEKRRDIKSSAASYDQWAADRLWGVSQEMTARSANQK
ncbi:MAG: SDR family oxidoreductase, partial [Dehalococcoidia bacterium]